MIEPVGTSGGPSTETEERRQPKDPITLTWLGQAGFLLEGMGERILIDPWFSPHELRTADPVPIDALGGPVGWLFATHEHPDHLDLPSMEPLLRHSPRLRLVVASPLQDLIREAAPHADVTPVQPGVELVAGRVRVRVVPAWHGVTVDDGYSDGGWSEGLPTRFVGYVIEFPAATLYHAGDTIAAEPLIETVREHHPDVALLPVNGRDFFRERRGILGNLDAREAVEMAVRIGARTLIPMHHDMVRGNTVRPSTVTDAVQEAGVDLHLVLPAKGQPIRLG
jgi:L-ascorbate 6-phosphate lactonase